MSENGIENELVNEQSSAPETLARQNAESVMHVLQEAFEVTRNRQNAQEPNPLMAVLSLYDEKPVEAWRESEYAKVLKSFQGVRGTDEENQLARSIRQYLGQEAADRNLDQAQIAAESATSTPTARSFQDVTHDIAQSLLDMSVMQREAKRQQFEQTAQALPVAQSAILKPALELLENVEEHYTNDVIAHHESRFEDLAFYPPTGDPEFDSAFPNILRTAKKAASREEWQDLYEATKDIIIRKGRPQHRALLAQMRQNVHAYARKEHMDEQYAKRGGLINKHSELPYSEDDRKLFEGTIDQTIEARMARILDQDQQKQATLKDKREYFKYLQRWTGIVLRNDKLVGKDGTLDLAPERRAMFLKIRDAQEPTAADIVKFTKYLQDEEQGRLTRYFKRSQSDEASVLFGSDIVNFVKGESRSDLIGSGIRDQEAEIENRISNSYLPETLDEVVGYLEAQFGEQYGIKPGDSMELIDVNGEFHLENFVAFARAAANYYEGESPKGEIDPLSSIVIKLPMGQVTLTEIVYSDQFRRRKSFKIRGTDANEKTIAGGWGEKEEHPDFQRYQAEVLLYELGYFAKGHNSSHSWLEKAGSAQGFKEEVNKFNADGFIARGNWTVFAQAASRKDGNDLEFKVGAVGAKENNTDGTLGRSMREMLIAYSHLTDFTEFHTYQKGDPRLGKKNELGETREVGKVKSFEDNTFYKYLEANGSNAFLHGVAESALEQYPEAKELYNKFIQERINVALKGYVDADPNLPEDAKKELAQLRNNYFELMKLGHRDARHRLEFNRNSLLEQFHKKARSIVGYGAYEAKDLQEQIRVEMLSNLQEGFLSKVCDIEVYRVDEGADKVSPIPTQRRYGEKNKKLGDVKFGKGDKAKTMREIITAFGEQNTLENHKKYIGYDFEKDEAPDTRSSAFIKYLRTNETMALAMGEVMGNLPRRDLNYFLNTDHDPSKENLVDMGIRKAIAETAFGLDDVEAEYSWRYAKNYLKPLGIAGALDTNGVGYDFWTRLIRPEKYLGRQLGRGYPVIHHLLHEYHMFGTHMLDMLEVRMPGEKIKEHSMASLFEGRDGYQMKSRKDRVIKDTINIEPGAQRNVLQNHIDNSINFLDGLKKGDYDFAKMFHKDFRGYPTFQKDVAVKLIGDLWKTIRYSTDQTGIDYSRIVNRDGIEQDMLHHAFGPKTRTLLEIMQKELYKDKPKMPYTNPGIGLFGTLVAAVIEEHRNDPGEHRWNLEQIKQIEFVLARATTDKFVQFTPKIFDSMLRMYNTDFQRMYTIEGLWAMFSILGILCGSTVNNLVEQIPQKK